VERGFNSFQQASIFSGTFKKKSKKGENRVRIRIHVGPVSYQTFVPFRKSAHFAKDCVVFVIYDSKTIGVVLNITSGKNLSFMLPGTKKLSFIYFLLPKKIPEFNFILAAGFTFAGVDTAGDPKLQNISICTPTNYGSAGHRVIMEGKKLILELGLG
jgi:hypothetical protein